MRFGVKGGLWGLDDNGNIKTGVILHWWAMFGVGKDRLEEREGQVFAHGLVKVECRR